MYLTFAGFPSGELSPSLDGRVDIKAISQGCRIFRNMIPTQLGAAYQRPGFMLRGLAYDQDPDNRVNPLPFVASADTAYIIEAGNLYFRFWRNNALLTTTAANVGKPGVASLLGEPLRITTPYDSGEVFELQYCHANDVMWICHPSFPPYKLVRYAVDEFEFAPMTFLWPPLRDQNVDEITLTATGDLTVGGAVTLTAVGGDVFLPTDEGGYYGIDHRRTTPFAEISLSRGSGTARALLIFSGNAVAGETFSVGTGPNLRTYTWDGDGPYSVPVGGTQTISANSAVDSINGASGSAPGTIAHPSVTAEYLGAFAGGVKAAQTLFFTGDNDLTAGSQPDEFSPGTQAYEFTLNAAVGPAYRVQVGATLADSINNAIMAINASGVAGVNYTAGTVANTEVAADPAAIGSALRVQALAAGSAGNAITTDVDHTSRMAWGGTTLTGGADGGTDQLQVTARIEGSTGNSIAVSEAMTNAAWDPVDFLTGGADNTNYDPSNPSAVIPTVRVNGTWEVYTLGRWYGLLTLEQQRVTGEWEVVRTWDSQNDRNVQATGTVNGEKLMRLTFVGSGINDDAAPARAVLTAIDAIVHGLVLITNVTSPTVAQGIVVKAIWSSEPTYLWSGGSWSERRGYPSAVVLHQQRLVFGHGSRLIGSQTGGFDNFLLGELGDDSYQFELAAVVAQNIVSMQSQEGLMVLTQTNEWLCDGGQNGTVITPSTFRTRQLTEYGSAAMPSQMVHSNVLFVQAGQVVLNEYLFQFARDNYEAVNLTELVDTLADELITGITWAPVPHSLVMATTRAGSLLIMGYRRTAGMAGEGGQLAWTKHTTPDASLGVAQDVNTIGDGYGKFEGVCAVPASNEVSDVWVSVRRQLPDQSYVRTIESWDANYFTYLKNGTPSNACLLSILDGSKKYAQIPITAVDGLGHLEGMTVGVLLNGMRHPDRVVNGGAIAMDLSLMLPGINYITVGLIPAAELQPFLTVIQMQNGLSEGRAKRIAQLNVRFYKAGAATYADTPEGPFRDVDFRTPADDVGLAVPLYSGLKKLPLAGGWALDTSFLFRNENVLPLNLLSVTAEMAIVG